MSAKLSSKRTHAYTERTTKIKNIAAALGQLLFRTLVGVFLKASQFGCFLSRKEKGLIP